jgi:hypothetical protein
VGGGFLANLNGFYEYLTMDRWFMRTMGRIRGTLKRDWDYMDQRKRFISALRRSPSAMKKYGITKEDLAQPINRNAHTDLAWSEDKALNAARKIFNAYASSNFARRTKLNKAAKNYYERVKAVLDAPEGGNAREFYRDTVRQAVEKSTVEGLTAADAQAIIWFPEKRLFRKFGVSDARGSLEADYEKEAERYVKKVHGINDQTIKRSLGQPLRGRSGKGRRKTEKVKPEAKPAQKLKPKPQFQARKAKKVPKKKSGKSIIEAYNKDKSLELKDATLWQWLVHKIQDNTVRLRLLSEGLMTQGPLSDEDDLYLLTTLMTGRSGDRINIFNDDIYIGKKSLLRRVIDAGFGLDEFGKYMMAQHARERNDHIANTKKGAPKDGGSGMSNSDAEEVLAMYKGKKKKQLESFARQFRKKVTQKDLKNRLAAGLITQEQYDKLSETFQYYVPLRVDMGEKGIIGQIARIGGKGYDVKGSEYFGIRRGHKGKPTINPVFSGIVQHQEGIVRSEKNTVAKAMFRLVDKYKSSAWSVRGQRKAPSYDENGEIVFFNYEKLDDNEMVAKIDGKTKIITINDELLLNALKNFDKTRAVPFLRSAMNYFRTIITTMNPEFFISNWQRDVQTALINITGEQSTAMAAKVVANLPSSIKGIWKEVRDKDSEWAKLYKELKAAGGKVGWFNIESIEDQRREIRGQLDRLAAGKGSPKRMGHKIGNFFDKLNEIVESSTRLAAYKAAIDAGMSKKRAAFLAKELTVNFNRTGAWGPYINSLYLFWNATVQGAFRVGTSIAKNPKSRALAAGVAANSAMQVWRNRMMCREAWEKIPEWEKDNYHIFIDPDCEAYSKFRVPFGYNIFHVMGSVAMDAALDHHQDGMPLEEIDYGKVVSRTLGAVSDAVNPFGAGAKGLNAIPTLARPYFEMKGNVKWNGSPIKPEQSFVDIPKSRQYYEGVSPTAKAITDFISESTGGKQLEHTYHYGLVEVSPEDLEYIMDFIGGGTGKFIKRTIDTGRVLAKEGTLPESRRVPFLRLFRAETPLKAEKSYVYKHVKQSLTKEFPESVMMRFLVYVDLLKEAEQITPTEAKRITTLMTNNQQKLRGTYVDPVKSKKPDIPGRRLGSRTRSSRTRKTR